MLGLKKVNFEKVNSRYIITKKKKSIPSLHEMEILLVYPACFWSYCELFFFFFFFFLTL